MLVPYNTDAPIYHLPVATIGLVVANVVTFIAPGALGQASRTALPPEVSSVSEHGINPLEWITGSFVYNDFGQWLTCLFFLWGFGLIVEGKIGWFRFLAIYVAICLAHGAIQQALLADDTGQSVGRSGATPIVFGLLGIAIVWAPKNEVNCYYFLVSIVPRSADVPVIVFGSVYAGLQVLLFIWNGYSVSTASLCLLGLALGIPIGIIMLKTGWVDCEGWDLFSAYSARGPIQQPRVTRRDIQDIEEQKRVKAEQDQKRQQLFRSIHAAIQSGQSAAAIALFHRHQDELHHGKLLPNNLLAAMSKVMQQEKRWGNVIPLLVEMLARLSTEQAIPVRLRLAQILVQAEERPRQALAVLQKLPPSINDQQRQRANQIASLAKRQIADGSVEIDIQDW
jgi:membrane associated rhomboid family serine protease